MNDRFAVMDLGTNMFHLLIVEGDATGFRDIIHLDEAVKLGEGGINKGAIQAPAFERGINCMARFQQRIAENSVQQVRAIATSALRNAANGQAFIDQVKTGTGIAIEIIDGDTEAGYIYKGIKASGFLSAANSLIVDIGGGSVEFIICNNDHVLWKRSFEIGVARLMDKFHHTDPIPPASITALDLYLEEQLQELFTAISKNPITGLIGAAGVFESYVQLLETANGRAIDLKKEKNYAFNKEKLSALIEKIVLSTHQERQANKAILPVRVDMIVTASLLTRFIIERLGICEVAMSVNSLKEGVLAEMMG